MVPQVMIDRMIVLVAEKPNHDPHLLREEIQKEFQSQEVYCVNDELYFAIQKEQDKYKPVSPIIVEPVVESPAEEPIIDSVIDPNTIPDEEGTTGII